MGDKKRKILTLCIVYQHPLVLLGMKKRGFGAGRWNGFGGKVNQEEAIETAALRELHEEAGITVKEIEQFGIIDFEFVNNPEILEVHIFKCWKIEGEPQESEEMKPKWFHIKEIPLKEMWADDEHWFPLFLADKKFRGKFLFEGEKTNRIIKYNLQEVQEIKCKQNN